MSLKNYSKTIIYKIQCGKTNIFGHTTNFNILKRNIKHDCISGKKTKISSQIMENGGYDQSEWFILEHYTECRSIMQANERVDYYKYKNLNPNESQMNLFESQMNPKFEKNAILDKLAQSSDDLQCKYCKKTFTLKTNLTRHIKKTCKKIGCESGADTDVEQMRLKLIEKEEEINRLKTQQLVSAANQTNIQTQNNMNNIQNNVNNINTNIQNNIVIELGKENISELFTTKQKKFILGKMYGSLDFLVEHLHCNPKYPQFNSVQITSLSKPYCKAYSEKHKKYVTAKTKDVIENIVSNRTEDIQTFLVEIVESGENVSQKIENAIKGMVEKMENDVAYKRDKMEKIRYAIYSYNPKTDTG